MKKIDIPVRVVGPGSQPAEDDNAEMDYLHMEADMSTYSMPLLPEPEELTNCDAAIALLDELLTGLSSYKAGSPALVFSLDQLDARNLDLINQVLGDGEVSIKYRGQVDANIQESVLAGVWRINYVDDAGNVCRDVIEVADIPGLVKESTFIDSAPELSFNKDDVPENAYNAAPLLTEIKGNLPDYKAGGPAHVVNLTLLPHTDEDIACLTDTLGGGPVVILSRGYGNCRITSTGTRNVWWVQYFNSQDTVILNTIEISQVPDVACAADEDVEDSAVRLEEILKVYR